MTPPPTSLFVNVDQVAWIERRPGVFWKTLWEDPGGRHKAILARYAAKHRIEVDLTIGEWTPGSGAAGEPEHRNLLNDIKDGGVGRLLVLVEVRHAVPDEVLDECRKAGVKVDFIDVQQERGLA